jgi:alpha,alpha-trehalase
MYLSDLALIGNCQHSALVSRSGSVVWSCMPRFDSPPLFASLLDELDGGSFCIAPADGSAGV